MPEKQTFAIDNHLDAISDRGGSFIREQIEERFHKIHIGETEDGSRERVFGNLEQPEAERILGDISELMKMAHAEMGNVATVEDVWKRAAEMARNKVYHSLEEGDEDQSIDDALTLGSMIALEDATRNGAPTREAWLPYSREAPYGTDIIMGEAAARAEKLGLCVQLPNSNFMPVSVAMSLLDMNERYLVSEEYEEAWRHEVKRRSPEENNAEIGRYLKTRDQLLEFSIDAHGLAISGYIDMQELSNLKEVLESGNCSTETLKNLIQRTKKHWDTLNAQSIERGNISIGQTFLVSEILPHISSHQLNELMADPEGDLRKILMAESIRGDLETEDVGMLTKIMKKIYNTTAVGIRKIADNDELLNNIVSRPEYKDIILRSVFDIVMPEDKFYEDRAGYESDVNYRKEVELYNKEVEQWVRERFSDTLGLPNDLADELRASIYARTRRRIGSDRIKLGAPVPANAHYIVELVQKLDKNIERIGIPQLKKIREKTGIINFDYYKPVQLDRMLSLIEGDEEVINYLQGGDVTVQFIDAKGDHNGAFSHAAEEFELPSGRTLFFEVHHPTDLYRYSLMLKKLGIKDSTRVIGAHGGAAGMAFGTGLSQFNVSAPTNGDRKVHEGWGDLTSEQKAFMGREWLDEIKVIGMRGSRKIVEDYMKVGEDGRKKLILLSCSMASEDLNYDGSSRSTARAIASDLNVDNLDVYGMAVPMSYRTDSEGVLRFYGDGELSKIRRVRRVNGRDIVEDLDGLKLYEPFKTRVA